jgi:hypothetical protein
LGGGGGGGGGEGGGSVHGIVIRWGHMGVLDPLQAMKST